MGPGFRACRLAGIACVFIGWCPVSHAADSAAWKYQISPYLWAATLTGQFGANGGVDTPVSPDYSFWSVDNLQAYASGHFEAEGPDWGWFVDGMYVDYSDGFDKRLLSTKLEVSGTISELGASHTTSIEGLRILGGGRYISAKVGVRLTPGSHTRATGSWLDPFVGVQWNHSFGERWYTDLRGDLGGFGVGADLDVQLIATIGAHLGRGFSLFGAYRYLTVDYDDEGLKFDATVAGPGIGLTWSW